MFRESIPVLVKKSKDKGDSNLIYETMLMTELQHENIPFLFGVNSAEKLLVMEFCALQNGSATESDTSPLFVDTRQDLRNVFHGQDL